MEIILAKSAGFCFGVKRAVDMVYEKIGCGQDIYTLGPIIHNDEVVGDLKAKGVKVIDDVNDISSIKSGTVVIRSHGVSKDTFQILEKSGLNIVDATCPFVKKIHKIVEEESKKGNAVVVIGSKNHPEVSGIVGWCEKTNPATVIENAKEAENCQIDKDKIVTVVSQTTFRDKIFKELVEILQKNGYNVNVVNTICDATAHRQDEARKIAANVDMMIVIGDSKSSNTQKLYEICSRECKSTQFVQTRDDLIIESKDSLQSVGITAGASTPKNIIEEVQNYVRINF